MKSVSPFALFALVEPDGGRDWIRGWVDRAYLNGTMKSQNANPSETEYDYTT
jgi:hypothetical protein